MDPKADYKPFKKVVEGGTILRLHGAKEQRAKVEADEVHIIIDAIAQGWDIDIRFADIDGDLDIRAIDERLERTEDRKRVIKGNIKMFVCNISGDADFASAQFSGDADFASAQFSGNALFGYAQFIGNADFRGAHFIGDADFRFAQFSGDADFASAQFSGNALFWSAHFIGNALFGYAQFIGSADFEYAQFIGSAYFGYAQFSGDADFGSAHFIWDAPFWSARFIGDADFGGAHFIGDASFRYAHFGRDTNFYSAHFSGDAPFWSAHFIGDADFENVVMAEPASFAGVKFRENHVIKGLWNVTLGRIERLHWQATDFSGFNTEKVMDGASNPWLKRYIDDELWIQSWRKRSWWREPLFTIWELTSHCGRSIGLWAFWSVLIAFVFGFLHKGHIEVGSVNNWYTPFYFSVVTFTTLGFGDVTPKDGLGQLWITLEVVLGYVMLGGLISIFANKLARRS